MLWPMGCFGIWDTLVYRMLQVTAELEHGIRPDFSLPELPTSSKIGNEPSTQRPFESTTSITD